MLKTFTIVVEDTSIPKRKTVKITTRMSVSEILHLWRSAGWDVISVNKPAERELFSPLTASPGQV